MSTTFMVEDEDAKELRKAIRALPDYHHGKISKEIHRMVQNHINLLKGVK